MRLNRSLRFAHVLIVCVSLLLAFFGMKTYDEQPAIGPSSRVEVISHEKSATGPATIAALTRLVNNRHFDLLARVSHDPDHPGTTFYAITPSGQSSQLSTWVTNGYPAFSRDTERAVLPISALPSTFDPRTAYDVMGSADDAQQIAAALQGLGMTVQTDQLFTAQKAAMVLMGGGAQLWCGLLVLLLVAALSMTGTLLDARRHAVALLQGHSLPQLVATCLRGNLVQAAIAAAVGAVIATACLLPYNHGHHLGLYLGATLGILLPLLAMSLAVQSLCLAVIARTSLLKTINGAVTFSAGTSLAYAVRVPAVLLLFVSTQTLLVNTWQLNNLRDVVRSADRLGPTAVLEFGVDGLDEPGPPAAALRRLGDQHQLLLATPVSSSIGLGSTPVRLLNERAYRALGATDAPRPGEALVVVPAGQTAHMNAVTAALHSPANPVSLPSGTRVRIVTPETPTDIATVAANGFTEPLPDDQILVVTPDNAIPLTDFDLVTAATSGALSIADEATARQLVSSPALKPYQLGVVTSRQLAKDQLTTATTQLRFAWVGMLMATLVSVASALVVSLVYMARRGKRDYVRFLAGWSLFQANRTILLLEGLGALLVSGWAIWSTLRDQRILADPPDDIPPTHLPVIALDGWDWAPVVIALAAGFAAFWWMLHAIHSRSVTSLSDQA